MYSNLFRACVHLTLLVIPLCHGVGYYCICTTDECQRTQNHICNASSMCYTQYLDRDDGRSPITQGCIDSGTPILCDNKPPDILDMSWPMLVCCVGDLCNKDLVPTYPPWMLGRQRKGIPSSGTDLDAKLSELWPDLMNHRGGVTLTPPINPYHWTHDPVFIIVPAVGLCILLAIIAFAAYILRQNRNIRQLPSSDPKKPQGSSPSLKYTARSQRKAPYYKPGKAEMVPAIPVTCSQSPGCRLANTHVGLDSRCDRSVTIAMTTEVV